MKAYFALTLLVAFIFNGSAQTGWYKFDKSNSSIPFEKAAYLDFDKSGNLWFGTNVTGTTGHLCRFDGSTFYPESFSAWIYGIKTDKNDKVWIINSNDELKSWDGNKWTAFTNSLLSWYSDPLYIDSKGVKWMNPGSNAELLCFNDSLWMICGGGNLVAYKDNTWTIYNSTLLTQNPFGIEINSGNIWIGQYSSVIKFDKSTFTVFNSTNSILPLNSFLVLKINDKGDVWVGTRYGLYKYVETPDSSIIIYEQPKSCKVKKGKNASFQVKAKGIGLGYQWFKNNIEIINADSSILFIPVMSESDTGKYFCRISNTYITVYSDTVNLGINNSISIITREKSSKPAIYFAPTKSELILESNEKSEYSLNIFNLEGKCIIYKNIKNETGFVTRIDLSSYPFGLYVAVVNSNTKAFFLKFIIK